MQPDPMAENRITEYNKESKTVSWFYNDHKDEKKHDVTDNVIDFINRLIIHIPDYHFLTTRYYGFYANASKKTLDKVHALLGIKKNKDYSRETRTKALKNKLNKFRYRTHLIDSFNRDPIQCKCGAIMQYTYTYNPLEDKRNDRTYRKRCIKDVLMKCTKCGYEEEVPRWLIDELFPNEPEENYMMHCPECDHKMIVKK